ncbi:uncharacterized protein LOC120780064 [Bactrocera tryoni]|uniref:uncharacterized protein LOC120780064 n=1 Tax=Bactrocera tryoni TaxID=59916 RepID=UPI001A96F2F5|nr:uncharacterized protein LOC120780064 [Bactrocera tryoni]
MVELLQQKPEMAQGFAKCPKEEAAAFWNNMAQELNSVGPPTKDISSWKKKYAAPFQRIEEAVITLMAIETITSGIENTVSMGLPMAADVGNAISDLQSSTAYTYS